ncbi:EamA family transporter [Klebsiella pneumoniae]
MGSSKKGMLNVLIAAVLWGSSGVCAQFIMQESQMSSPFLTMTRLLFGGAMLLPFYGGQGTDFVVNGSLLLAFFYLVVIGTSLTFSLYLNGAQKIGGAKAGILSCAEPLSSALLSLLLLGITFTLPDWLGTLLILASVVLIAIDSRRRVRAA